MGLSYQSNCNEFAQLIKADPRNYIAIHYCHYPLLPVLVGDHAGAKARRPAPIHSAKWSGSYVTAGGLTRVALVKGSYIVNSSPRWW